MGSRSDWETMRHCSDTLTELGVPHECLVVSAHRTPDWLMEYASTAEARGLQVLVAGAGDQHLQAARFGGRGVLHQPVGRAVGGHHEAFVRHAEFGQRVAAVAHGLPVGPGAHDDADQRGWR